MTTLQNNLMHSFLNSLIAGQKAVAKNGRVLTFEGKTSDGHSFTFSIEGISGRKVYSNLGVGSALPETFSIDLSASLGLSEQSKAEPAGVPAKWVSTLLKTGALKMFGYLEVQGRPNAKAIYKGLSSRGLPIFSIRDLCTQTFEFDFDGVKAYEKGPISIYHKMRLKVPSNFFSLDLTGLFAGVRAGDTFETFDGSVATVERVDSNGSLHTRVKGYSRRYNSNGIALTENYKHSLISKKEPVFVIPTISSGYCRPSFEIAPGVFRSRVSEKTKPVTKQKKVVSAKPPVEKISTKVLGIPTLQSLTAFLSGAKEKFLILSEGGQLLKAVDDEKDAQFETTMWANAAPGTKVQLVKVQVLGYSEVPKPVAVFKPV